MPEPDFRDVIVDPSQKVEGVGCNNLDNSAPLRSGWPFVPGLRWWSRPARLEYSSSLLRPALLEGPDRRRTVREVWWHSVPHESKPPPQGPQPQLAEIIVNLINLLAAWELTINRVRLCAGDKRGNIWVDTHCAAVRTLRHRRQDGHEIWALGNFREHFLS